jgi:hypothetical protein
MSPSKNDSDHLKNELFIALMFLDFNYALPLHDVKGKILAALKAWQKT